MPFVIIGFVNDDIVLNCAIKSNNSAFDSNGWSARIEMKKDKS